MAAPWIKPGRISRRVIVVLGAVFGVAALGTSTWLWEHDVMDRIVLPSAAPARDVTIVLGAKPGRLLEQRMDAACALVALGTTQRLLLTGTEEEMPYMRARALSCLPEAQVIIDDDALRTLDNIRNARDRFGVREALVVSQRFHLARALYLADALGVDAVGVEAQGDVRLLGAIRERFARIRAIIDVVRM